MIQKLFKEYSRYIDDILSLFQGDKEKCEWAFQQFNGLYPGELVLTWEWSEEKVIFLNIELFLNRNEKIIVYCARVSNQLWLPRAVFSTNKKWTLKPRWQPVMGTLTQKSMTLSENWNKTFSHYQQFAHTQGKQF